MRSFILIFSFLLSNTFAQDSFNKGTISLGGGISFSSKIPEKGSTTTILNVRPQFDYFIMNNLSLGLNLNIENTLNSGLTHSIIGLGPGARYYFDAGNINPFFGLSYVYAKDKWFSDGDKFYDRTETQIVIEAGMELFIYDCLAVEPVILYKFIDEKNEGNPYIFYLVNPIGFYEGNSRIIEIGLGLKYFIN